jgi:uncharacterized protein involved in high-affinity Fe2+ transport
MRKLLAVVIVLAFAAGLAAQAQQQVNPAQKPNNKAALNVTGKWAMTLEMSMGTGTPMLELKQDGEKITGTYTGRYGDSQLAGTLKERTIEFTVTMVAEGETVSMSFGGQVAEDGQTMKGNAVLGELGDATWSAKKEKTTDMSSPRF